MNTIPLPVGITLPKSSSHAVKIDQSSMEIKTKMLIDISSPLQIMASL